jgi:hypothetical protein
MSEPISIFWRKLGYEVKAEVHHCDLVAIRAPEEPIIIEMKLLFSIPLLAQAAERRKTSTRVYVAIPAPQSRNKLSDYKLICRAMQIGLLTVTPHEVVEILSPDGTRKQKQNKARKRLETEFHARKTNLNVGGTTRKKQMTSYREQAIECARALIEAGEHGLKSHLIRKQTGNRRTASIIRNNVYGWFVQIEGLPHPDGTRQLPTYRLHPAKISEIMEWLTVYESALQRS